MERCNANFFPLEELINESQKDKKSGEVFFRELLIQCVKTKIVLFYFFIAELNSEVKKS